MENNTITLISRNGKNKIVCYKYMQDYFQKIEGFASYNNIYINLLYKFLRLKIFSKLNVLIMLILRSKFYFRNPERSKIVIFDCETANYIEKILPKKDFVIISSRSNKINKVYLSRKIVYFLIKNFFKNSLKINYLTALIELITPKIVITHISHSTDFHIVSKMLSNKIKFIAIQSGTSNEISFMSDESLKKFFIPELFCFGEYDKLYYKKKKINVSRFQILGSIKSSLSYDYVKSKELKINPSKYDINLISETQPILDGDFLQVKNMADCIGLVAEFTHKLCKKHNLNLVFSGEGELGKNSGVKEIHFYKHYLKDYDFKIYQSTDRRKEYPSYVNIMQSKVTIGFISTILREAISFDKKILSCNFTDHPDVGFPGPVIEFSEKSICILKEPSYELFEERVLKILSMNNDEYFKQIDKEKSFIMMPTIETSKMMKNQIRSYL